MTFMNNAAANTAFQDSIAGLTGYDAYRLRPGVQIENAASDGDLSVDGDINLVGYRYGAGAVNFDPDTETDTNADVGDGQPGVLDIRAAGNLNIYGSITDGFDQPITDAGTAGKEFNKGWVVFSSEPYDQNQVIPTAISIEPGSALADSGTVNFPVAITGGTFQADSVAPVQLTVTAALTTSVGFVTTSAISGAGVDVPAGTYLPAGTLIPQGATIAAGGTFPFALSVGGVTWPANTPFTVLTSIAGGATGVILSGTAPVLLAAGAFIPQGSTLIFPSGASDVLTRNVAGGTQGQLYGLASLLPEGDLSWALDLVSGADTNAASADVTQPEAVLAASGGSGGNITLADTHYGIQGSTVVPAYSVIRTGTGALSLVAGGSVDEVSSFGVYTAGSQSAAVADQALYDLPQGDAAAGTLLGAKNAALATLADNYIANYPTDGGNVVISAQGDLNGFIDTESNPNSPYTSQTITDSDAIGQWLWQQGGAGEPTAWWIEYGSLTLAGQASGGAHSAPAKPYQAQYTGFQGIGTLGGGNLTVNAGGNASGLDLVVASNGRVAADGKLTQDGGGALNVSIGGAVNFIAPGSHQTDPGDAGGLISDLRGDTDVSVGSVGTIVPIEYGTSASDDIRFLSPLQSETADFGNGIDLAPGDGTVTVDARGDLAIDAAVNPGTVQNYVNTPVVPQGSSAAGGLGATDFSLWTGSTAIDLNSAGGDVSPKSNLFSGNATQNESAQDYYTPTLIVTAQNGDIYFGTQAVELAPSTDGELELLAADSIIGELTGELTSLISMSGAALSAVATPSDPGIVVLDEKGSPLYTNHSALSLADLIDFGPDTPSGPLHADDTQPARIYAGTGDILNVQFGQYTAATITYPILVQAAKPFDVYAGRDIVDSGTIASPNIFLNLSGTDISTVTAGRDIIESSFDIAGPGNLVVQAGRNYEALAQGVIDSIGPLFDIDPSNRDDGAAVTLLAGVGAGPDYTSFADQFLDPASALVLSNTNGVNVAGTVVQGEDAALYSWLQQNAGYTGTQAGAYGFFETLPAGQQQVFLRLAYFSLLNTSGLDFNLPGNNLGLYKTYVLGRDTIAALFPAGYDGSITMYGGSGIHTDFGGDIETLTPGGATTIGVEGTTPPASAGILTQGNGDIDIYAQDSVELGESRVLTTFGGNILIWSAQGDINAGRGSKTTIDYTPLQRIYDNYGDVFLSPSVPSSGAGIGTLSPIPSVAAGNINLIAPLGTIDAGEAGIRSSGNTNLVAPVVLNGANISTKGSTTGAPTAVSPNVGALTSTSNAAGAAAQAAEGNAGRTQAAPLPSIWIVEILGFGGGNESTAPAQQPQKKRTQKI